MFILDWIAYNTLQNFFKQKPFKNLQKTAIKMINDMQLAVFANLMGVLLFVMVVAYHFVATNTGEAAVKKDMWKNTLNHCHESRS